MQKEERTHHGGNHRSGTTKSKNTEHILYACHIFGLNGHRMIDCLKFAEMQKMFHGISLIVTKVQPVSKTQTVIVDVNVVDVNVTTRSKVTKEQMFKDKELRK
jgi:hypothetical protein